MRTDNPEQFYEDEREARLFAWDSEPEDTGDSFCEFCDVELSDKNTSTEDVVCDDCLEKFCKQLKGDKK